jgi:predicted nucleic acid-binding protein
MIVVSDTSPLSNLFTIGRLDLLQLLYGKIIIPGAVMNELLELENRGIDLSPIKAAQWIEIV